VAAEKEPQTSGRSSRLGRSARRLKIPPLPIESLPSDEPENLLDAERHCRPLGYKFCSQNFRGQKFCNAEGCFFGIFRVSLEYFFEQNLFEKITGSPIFSTCMACSSKISFDLRSPEIFEELENLYPMFLHSFRVSASAFEI
jgi:hypothetical protein